MEGYRVETAKAPMREILHFLGWRGSAVEEKLAEEIREAAQEMEAQCEPRLIFRRLPLSEGKAQNAEFVPLGKDIEELLSDCPEMILMAATLGSACDRFLQRWQVKDPAHALLLDAAASATIEAILDREEAELRKKARAEGLFLTDRFSPGYGDMPLSQGRKICEVLETGKRIGLAVSMSGIMIPQKSVTAVMGLCTHPKPRRPGPCTTCNARGHCQLRRTETDYV